MTLNDTTPILRVFDEDKAREFYAGFLGFDIEWEHRFEDGLPLYLEISRDNVTIHLSEHHGDCCPGAAVRLGTDNLAELHKELTRKKYRHARPSIDDTPWGTREMSVKDPFGNRIVFVANDGK